MFLTLLLLTCDKKANIAINKSVFIKKYPLNLIKENKIYISKNSLYKFIINRAFNTFKVDQARSIREAGVVISVIGNRILFQVVERDGILKDIVYFDVEDKKNIRKALNKILKEIFSRSR